jgi:NADPH-dependent glutamate synthase beta subunit-like oxidoreductase
MKRVAIVGAGPAGLTAAKMLLPKGYAVDIYDREHVDGGVMAFGIPAFRIPESAVEKQVEPAKKLGANFLYGKDLKESDFLKLAEEYDYVYLAFGLTKVRHLGIPGDDLPECLNALEFLRQYNFADKLKLTSDLPVLFGNVIVVGAGNVAMDGARVAVRTGAAKTTIVYRRDRKNAPCKPSELEDAEKDGVELCFLTNPVEVIGKDGHVCAVKCEKMKLGEIDASGRQSPIGTGEYVTLPCDYIISAIGQIPDHSVWNVGKIRTNRDYIVGVNQYGECYQTSVPNIFAGGDIVLGAKTIGAAVMCGMAFAKYVLAQDAK